MQSVLVMSIKDSIDEILASRPNLRCMPFVALKAINIIDNPRTTIRELSDLICTDATLTSRILRVCNSAEYALRSPIDDVMQGIHFLGFETVKDTVLKSSTEQLKENSILKNLFKENLLIANMAREMCKQVDDFKIGDAAYVAGLIQGIGKLFYMERFPTEYMHMFNYKGNDLMTQERQTFGYTYPEISARLVESWGLSPLLTNAIKESHNTPILNSNAIDIALYYGVGMSIFEKKLGIGLSFLNNANKNDLAKLNLRPFALKQIFQQGYAAYDRSAENFEMALN